MKTLLRITAPHFVAGIEIGGRCAPILRWMKLRRWNRRQIEGYCFHRGWTCKEVE